LLIKPQDHAPQNIGSEKDGSRFYRSHWQNMAGCNDYLSKPIDKDELLRLMQKYFKK
jgi:CheY-like chemotaxis protein